MFASISSCAALQVQHTACCQHFRRKSSCVRMLWALCHRQVHAADTSLWHGLGSPSNPPPPRPGSRAVPPHSRRPCRLSPHAPTPRGKTTAGAGPAPGLQVRLQAASAGQRVGSRRVACTGLGRHRSAHLQQLLLVCNRSLEVQQQRLQVAAVQLRELSRCTGRARLIDRSGREAGRSRASSSGAGRRAADVRQPHAAPNTATCGNGADQVRLTPGVRPVGLVRLAPSRVAFEYYAASGCLVCPARTHTCVYLCPTQPHLTK